MSSGLKFGNLNYLFLLWAVPAVYLLFWLGRLLSRRAARTFSSRELAPRLTLFTSSAKERLKTGLLALSLILLTLALIAPKWGYRAEEMTVHGPDVMVALDVSRSMLAQDTVPDRLSRAKLEIKSSAAKIPAGRIGLVVFAGTAFIQCPVTSDLSALSMFVDGVSVQSVPHGGTAIGAAIRKSVEALRRTGSSTPVVLLFSDGEDLGTDALQAAEHAAKEAVTIHTIGVGSAEGAPIPLQDQRGNIAFVKEPDGTVHLSRLNERMLQEIAAQTGGTYSNVSSSSWSLDRIISADASRPAPESKTKVVRYYHERFQLPLFVAFLLILAEAALPRGRRGHLPGEVR